MLNRCCDCIWWNFSYDNGSERFGKCNNLSVTSDIRIVREDDIEDLFTSEFFGCVWFEKENKAVVIIDPKIK